MRDTRKPIGKYMGTYTARGKGGEIGGQGFAIPQRIQLFDGEFDTAYVVREFYVWGDSFGSSSSPDVIGKLAKTNKATTGVNNFMDATDTREIAWAASAGAIDAGLGFGANQGIVDPENIVIEDLWFYGRHANSAASVNYMVVMDKYKISDAHGAVVMAKDKSSESETAWQA
jgi:hypothetical protein